MPYNSYMPYGSYYRLPYMDNNQQFNNYQIPPVAPQPTQPTANNDIIWVQGEAGAKAYLVAPNTTVTLWDSESPTIYLKTSDGRGIPSMRILDFTERTPQVQKAVEPKPVQNGSNERINAEISELRTMYESFDTRLKELETKSTAPVKSKKEKETD